MPNKIASGAWTADANDMTALVASLQSCLTLADTLDLPMVAIHIEHAYSWMVEQGLAPEVPRSVDQLA